jgi:hypothetical protein
MIVQFQAENMAGDTRLRAEKTAWDDRPHDLHLKKVRYIIVRFRRTEEEDLHARFVECQGAGVLRIYRVGNRSSIPHQKPSGAISSSYGYPLTTRGWTGIHEGETLPEMTPLQKQEMSGQSPISQGIVTRYEREKY